MSAPAPAAATSQEAAPVSENKIQESQQSEADDVSVEELSALESEDSNGEPSSGEQSDKQQVQDAVNKEIQKWILKGNKGEQIEISDINELVQRAQKGLGAELKFQEAAEIKKEAAQLVEMLSKDPLGLLEELGIDTVKLSQEKLAKLFEEQQKSPEQKQREQELKELEEARSRLKQIEEEKRQAEYKALVAEEERKLEEGMLGALQKNNLPVKPAYIKRMAEVMQAGLAQGVELTPEEALGFARKEVVSDLRELLDAAPDEMLEDLIGSNNAKRMRKRYLAKAREKSVVTPSQIKSTGETSESREPKERKPKGTIRDWMKGKISLD